jgi:hypothetical protein
VIAGLNCQIVKRPIARVKLKHLVVNPVQRRWQRIQRTVFKITKFNGGGNNSVNWMK